MSVFGRYEIYKFVLTVKLCKSRALGAKFCKWYLTLFRHEIYKFVMIVKLCKSRELGADFCKWYLTLFNIDFSIGYEMFLISNFNVVITNLCSGSVLVVCAVRVSLQDNANWLESLISACGNQARLCNPGNIHGWIPFYVADTISIIVFLWHQCVKLW